MQRGHLPATPKSAAAMLLMHGHPSSAAFDTDTNGSAGSAASTITTSSLTAPSAADAGYDEPEPVFVLAPTPAQLGRAPLQRRQNMGMFFVRAISCSKYVQMTWPVKNRCRNDLLLDLASKIARICLGVHVTAYQAPIFRSFKPFHGTYTCRKYCFWLRFDVWNCS